MFPSRAGPLPPPPLAAMRSGGGAPGAPAACCVEGLGARLALSVFAPLFSTPENSAGFGALTAGRGREEEDFWVQCSNCDAWHALQAP